MITIDGLFPFIPREGFKSQVLDVISVVARDRQNQVVLLYGDGGIGKTSVIRELPEASQDPPFIRVGPYDVDDAEYWLLPNLEREIANRLDPERRFFAPYFDYQSKLPVVEIQRVGFETILAYSRQGEKIFFDCYRRFVTESRKIPVLVLDTLEAIRGLDFLPRLVRWMKGLTSTVFILASRPMFIYEREDPLLVELKTSPVLPYRIIKLERFTDQESGDYLRQSAIGAALSAEQKQAIIDLCGGYPLWLALTVSYLSHNEIPKEIETWSNRDAITAEYLRDDFLRRLTVPYSGSDFWAAAVKYLGVVRRRVSRRVWQRLMADRAFPDGVTNWEAAWKELKSLPWIRTRANENYVTLHDAVAEALAQRVIPLDDKDHSWRKKQWDLAAEIYWELVKQEKQSLEQSIGELKQALGNQMESQAELHKDWIKLNVRTTEYHLLVSTAFYYLMLSDREAGIEKFRVLYDESYSSHAYRWIELLWLELQRFLPGEQTFDPLDDIIRPELNRFQDWYKNHPDCQYEVERRLARYFTYGGKPGEALKWLNHLLEMNRDNDGRVYRLLNLRGNARLRLAGASQLAGEDFKRACDLARKEAAPESVKRNLGEALKELGYYYRNIGNWLEAAKTYRAALEVTPITNIEARAAIQSQYAYVLAFRGRFQEAQDTIESALKIRRRLGNDLYVGMALSVKGEVRRYRDRFEEALTAYFEAERIFLRLAQNPWLGVIRQEMAICFYQAARAGEILPPFADRNEMLARARELALEAITLCRDYDIRSLPMALNRSGRIIGESDVEQGLKYLEEGIRVARSVADEWLHFASLIEYVTLCFTAWETSRERQYRDRIDAQAAEIERAMERTEFDALKGRWNVLQGHLKALDALDTGDLQSRHRLFDQALNHYKDGYLLIVKGYPASRSSAALQERVRQLEDLMTRLPAAERERWLTEMDAAWRNLPPQEKDFVAALSAMVTDLYIQLK
ncbi:MAG TPA: tetratricopeptide repeat protein [Blastocatellia bacterium]|nr:tetratricopeptide repeat protein [Blastocatellia bacterium]